MHAPLFSRARIALAFNRSPSMISVPVFGRDHAPAINSSAGVSLMTRVFSRVPATPSGFGAILVSGWAALAASTCPDERATPQVPKDYALCQKLEPIVHAPSAHSLNEYETALNQYLQALC